MHFNDIVIEFSENGLNERIRLGCYSKREYRLFDKFCLFHSMMNKTVECSETLMRIFQN